MPRLGDERPKRPSASEPEPTAQPGPIAEPDIQAVEQAFVDSYVRLLEVSLSGPAAAEQPQTSGATARMAEEQAAIGRLEAEAEQAGMGGRLEPGQAAIGPVEGEAVSNFLANAESLRAMQEQIGMAAQSEEIRNRLLQSILGKFKAMQF
jgi:hypothetical protein